jgi:hypothetical protein
MATNPLPVQLSLAPQIPTVPTLPPIKAWKDIISAFNVLVLYLRTLVQFLSQLLGKYAADINLLFGAAQTLVATSVSLPNNATTKIGNVKFNKLIALASGDFIAMSVQGGITPSKSFNVIIKGDPSGVQISGLPNVTVTSDASGNFHFNDNGSVTAGMIGDTSLDYFIFQNTGGTITLTSATLGANTFQSL